ncbi:uncharacterized protein A4U43_C05F34290 [Asparagus officinalis]|uniref:RNase III domain-containing protein n=1 Tax=Asparagus officinalis TaxID=4686 RepID=A0A5P1EXB1_ASPOF|nr:uncharacterized protein A4U43_C05F34290 [Asparagus officinalis]
MRLRWRRSRGKMMKWKKEEKREDKLRSYEFQSVDLLRRAMTHSSYSHENFRSLSILGLSVIQTSVSMKLLTKDLDVSAKEMNIKIAEVFNVEGCTLAPLPDRGRDWRRWLEFRRGRTCRRRWWFAPLRAIFSGVVMDSETR